MTELVTVTNGVGTGSGSTYTYTKGATTTTVASSQNPSVSGQAVAFTATVTSGATGNVAFTITPSHGSAVACNGGDTVALSSGMRGLLDPRRHVARRRLHVCGERQLRR